MIITPANEQVRLKPVSGGAGCLPRRAASTPATNQRTAAGTLLQAVSALQGRSPKNPPPLGRNMGRGDCVSHGSAQRDDLLCMCVTGGGDLCNAVKRCGDGCGEAWRFLLRPWFEGSVRIGEFSVMESRLPSADRVRPVGRVLKPTPRAVIRLCAALINDHISADIRRFSNRLAHRLTAQFIFLSTSYGRKKPACGAGCGEHRRSCPLRRSWPLRRSGMQDV